MAGIGAARYSAFSLVTDKRVIHGWESRLRVTLAEPYGPRDFTKLKVLASAPEITGAEKVYFLTNAAASEIAPFSGWQIISLARSVKSFLSRRALEGAIRTKGPLQLHSLVRSGHLTRAGRPALILRAVFNPWDQRSGRCMLSGHDTSLATPLRAAFAGQRRPRGSVRHGQRVALHALSWTTTSGGLQGRTT